MANAENIKGKGFDKYPEHINKKGAGVSIKKQLKELLLKQGELTIPKKDFIKETETAYIFKIATQESLALKMLNIAMSKTSNNLKAIQLILETFDGKAKQEIENKIDIKDRIKGITFNKDE